MWKACSILKSKTGVLEHTNKTVVQIFRKSNVLLLADLGKRLALCEMAEVCLPSFWCDDQRLGERPKGQSQEVNPSKDIVECLGLEGIGHKES